MDKAKRLNGVCGAIIDRLATKGPANCRHSKRRVSLSWDGCSDTRQRTNASTRADVI